MKTSIILFAIAGILTSCGRSYTYKKVIHNATRKAITVTAGCCGNERITEIPAGASKAVFVCTYQSFRKPDCSDVGNSISIEMENETKSLSSNDNWFLNEKGKTISCTYTLQE